MSPQWLIYIVIVVVVVFALGLIFYLLRRRPVGIKVVALMILVTLGAIGLLGFWYLIFPPQPVIQPLGQIPVQMTVIVPEVTRQVMVTRVVTQEVPVEVTREVEVTRVVTQEVTIEVTREVEVTRVVTQSIAVPTATPLPTATSTMTPLPTATSTMTPLPTATSTSTPLPTATSTSTPLPTATSTSTPLPTATSTSTPLPTPDCKPLVIQWQTNSGSGRIDLEVCTSRNQ